MILANIHHMGRHAGNYMGAAENKVSWLEWLLLGASPTSDGYPSRPIPSEVSACQRVSQLV